MTTLIAWRNLTHDLTRLLVTLTGVVFSVVLMGMQSGLLIGFGRAAANLVEHSSADLWVVARGTQNVDVTAPLQERRRFQALAVPGVQSAEPYLVQFGLWMRPDGGNVSVCLVAQDNDAQLGGPWNLVEGHKSDLRRPGGVIVDRLYADKLGIAAVNDTIEIRGKRARVVGFTHEIRTFTQSPYVFTSLSTAQDLLDLPASAIGYVLIKLAAGADPVRVKQQLQARMPDVTVLTKADFAKSSSDYWLFTTGAGVSLVISALLGLIVGIAIVAQTLYASTIDRLPEYATLKAMGAPNAYLYKIITAQAAIAAVIGYAVGMGLVVLLVFVSRTSSAAPILPASLAVGLGFCTLAMCIGAAVLSIRRVMTIDPVGVFR
jgi:putative ABC transport system permease protein